MDVLHRMNEKEIMKACKPLLVHDSYCYLLELLRRRQSLQIKAVCSLNNPTDIYRAQGQVKAYDKILNIDAEIKAL